jgi:Kef-type K+ transport system membrane component KefB
MTAAASRGPVRTGCVRNSDAVRLGSVVFVPIFLVSVGFLLQPSVMVEGETLKLAGLFILAGIGGKAVASLLCRGALQLSTSETALMLGMTLPQAAATLAASSASTSVCSISRWSMRCRW